jgi:hypothetical protein
MENYGAETYGERIADIYDDLYAEYDPAAIALLRDLAHGGPALELGIGTGRIALPLQQSGIEVRGIDASEPMVARLRAKSGGGAIPITFGDFADVAVEGEYALIYVLFNTFYALLSQEDQVRCMANVAGHLGRNGVFVIEAFVPDLSRFTGYQAVRAVRLEQDRVQLDVSQWDPVRQHITSQHMLFSAGGCRLVPVEIRYVWPAELDLMARLAGLNLKHRWSDWRRGEFSEQSGKHISIYGR